MGSAESARRRWRRIAPALEALEGRALLSSVTSSGAIQVEPTGVHSAAVDPTASKPHTQTGGGNVGDALNVGGKYTKALFASSTGTVISDYTKALLRGNGKQLNRLGNSSAVKQTNANFQNVTQSAQAKAIGHSFHKLGSNISHDFHKIFG
jgi:hypothetical protein